MLLRRHAADPQDYCRGCPRRMRLRCPIEPPDPYCPLRHTSHARWSALFSPSDHAPCVPPSCTYSSPCTGTGVCTTSQLSVLTRTDLPRGLHLDTMPALE